MARPLRIEYAGALYHITSRGNAQVDIYRDQEDRNWFLSLLAECCDQFHWRCHAYCLMSNHYHLLVVTDDATLSSGMRYLNGVYSQHFNARHRRAGHLLQGRFKSILVDRTAYLLELSRYIVLNPVRAHMVAQAEKWPWSSYRATAGLSEPHPALTVDWILNQFGGQRTQAILAYRQFVESGKNQPSPWEQLRNQVYLGSDSFITSALAHVEAPKDLAEIPKVQRRVPAKSLEYYRQLYCDRDLAMHAAYLSGQYTHVMIGSFFGVGRSTVARAIARVKNNG